MDLSIIIPNFNGKKLLENNLPKVLEAGKDCEIIIVDDASTDGSVEFLKKEFPQIKVLQTSYHPELVYSENSLELFRDSGSSSNKGFSASVNLGVSHAKSDFVFLLNSDCYPEKGSIEKVIKLFEDRNLFAVGFAQKNLEDGKTVIRGRALGKFEKGFFVHSYGSPDKTTTQWVGGGAGVFKKSLWDRLGGMDEIYNPFYWEDIDLSYRALKSGYSIRFVPDAYVVHEQSKGTIRSHYSDSYIKSISYRNQILFVWLNISDPYLLLSHFFYYPYEVIKSWVRLVWYVVSRRKNKIRSSSDLSFIKADIASELKFFLALGKRFQRKKMWKKKDKECFVKN
ncbi:hypothetical protein A3D77_07170 [Candidatus Gottesmanbacteria bacterium RIFCSPHIGHO2_02_FULL_39_11]|uniref:Glycosyltransferase 2-like domain-containing protein n=1 Tax=Candidatus Gottesmanbacteria bacterium RIFCSPHIGHO2_02_FULL_39_11 TaxID=1798382 RepID=A0A1F5ZJY6_9BACT|nr:MAG: hypothetical protein A3D77_07170 [Candidatus Gottesmanbacteria bacterium RIFCSPHIGHO2_02_FULL_39_11]